MRWKILTSSANPGMIAKQSALKEYGITSHSFDWSLNKVPMQNAPSVKTQTRTCSPASRLKPDKNALLLQTFSCNSSDYISLVFTRLKPWKLKEKRSRGLIV